MTKNPMDKLLVSKGEAAYLLSISEKKLWNITSPRGPVPAIHLGARILYSVEALRMFIRTQEEKMQETLSRNDC